jgi:hypothetical protein
MTRRAIGPMISVYPDTKVFRRTNEIRVSRFTRRPILHCPIFDQACVTQIGIVSHPLRTPAPSDQLERDAGARPKMRTNRCYWGIHLTQDQDNRVIGA